VHLSLSLSIVFILLSKRYTSTVHRAVDLGPRTHSSILPPPLLMLCASIITSCSCPFAVRPSGKASIRSPPYPHARKRRGTPLIHTQWFISPAPISISITRIGQSLPSSRGAPAILGKRNCRYASATAEAPHSNSTLPDWGRHVSLRLSTDNTCRPIPSHRLQKAGVYSAVQAQHRGRKGVSQGGPITKSSQKVGHARLATPCVSSIK
jgi:hypothetical protein